MNYNNNPYNPYGPPQQQAPPTAPGFQSGFQPGYQQPGQAPYGAQANIYPTIPQSLNNPAQQQPYPTNQYPTQPQYPGYQPQYPGSGYQQPQPQQQPGYQQPAQQPYGYPSNPYQQNRPMWDERNYLQKLFQEIDHNRDGEISTNELHEALRRGQQNHEFDPYTVQFLLQKFDRNGDNEISFQEFYELYVGLNIQYNEFLDIDQDSSGLIDGRELGNAMRRKGYNFSQDIFDYIVNEISRRSGKRGISFDTYVRLIARFDFLRDQYNRMPYKNLPLDRYIRDGFF